MLTVVWRKRKEMKKEGRGRRTWRALRDALLDVKRTDAKRWWKTYRVGHTLKTRCSRNSSRYNQREITQSPIVRSAAGKIGRSWIRPLINAEKQTWLVNWCIIDIGTAIRAFERESRREGWPSLQTTRVEGEEKYEKYERTVCAEGKLSIPSSDSIFSQLYLPSF